MPTDSVRWRPYYLQFRDDVAAGQSVSVGVAQAVLDGRISAAEVRSKADRFTAWLDSARIYVIDKQTTDCIEHNAARFAAVPQFEPPVPNAWIEFEDGCIQRAGTGQLVRAVTVWPEGFRDTATPPPVIDEPMPMGLPTGAGPGYRMLFWLGPTQYMSAFWCATGGLWSWKAGSCSEAHPCPLAELRNDWFPSTLLMPNVSYCTCAAHIFKLARFLSTLMALLRADGIEQTIVTSAQESAERGVTGTPSLLRNRQPTLLHRPAQAPLRWVRISLSVRRHVLGRREGSHRFDQSAVSSADGNDPAGVATARDAGVPEKSVAHAWRHVQVATHPRLLIPGPDKPWRGTVPRIIWVTGHERRVPGAEAIVQTGYRAIP